MLRKLAGSLAAYLVAALATLAARADDTGRLTLEKGDRVVLIGNTLAERMQYFGHWEALLHSRFPKHELVVRNLGWSADEVALRPRSKDFQDHGHTLADHKPDVVLAFFGLNESFGGQAGLAKFESDLDHFLAETTSTAYNGRQPPKVVLFSPIAHENLFNRSLPDGAATNRNIETYIPSMKSIAARHGVMFVDLYTPSRSLMEDTQHEALTINGVHLSEHGDRLLARVIDKALFGEQVEGERRPPYEMLRAAVQEKNLQFFYDHRAVNGYYIYGGRKNPFGVVNFPAEFAKLRNMIAARDRRIWDVAQRRNLFDKIDDGQTGEFTKITSNVTAPIVITTPEDSRATFTLHPGFECELFASEIQFPDLRNPCQFAFDAKGRLWVTTMQSYPMYLPGTPVDDKVLILEDTDGDGRADKQTIFADKLHIPTGIELFDGGAYVAQQPNLMRLTDTDGDDHADTRELVLHGFDSADSHHSISAFTYDQGGALYFEEGTFHRSQIETPYGPERVLDAGVFRWEPRSWKLDIFVSYRFANPWGHIFDRWGQDFVADASPGANYYAAAFSGDVDYPDKHGSLKQFLVKQWRPTAGCELVSSRNFPDEMQGNYLLNNCIGFQGVLQYKMRDDGSGFAADPVEPLLRSGDANFRPVDIEFGPDGAVYVCDWFNPLVGHMQHSIRDPNRDHNHGRIWRIYCKDRPLVEPVTIAGRPTAELLRTLSSTPEERTRAAIRRELWGRDTDGVLSQLARWTAELDSSHAEHEHDLLEALWMHQAHDVVDQKLLDRALRSPDARARAAATRVLCYWRDRVREPLELLRTQVNDEHPRVRLEAIRALSFFDSQKAIEVAVESLIHTMDDYLNYTLQETLNTLEKRVAANANQTLAADPVESNGSPSTPSTGG